MNIKRIILVSMIVLTSVCGIGVLISSTVLFYNASNINLNDKINVAANVLEQTVRDLRRTTYVAALNIANMPDLAEDIKSGDRHLVERAAHTLSTLAQLEAVTLLDNEGNVLYRAHAPDEYGDNMADTPAVRSALTGEINVYIAPGPVILLGVIAGAPIYDDDKNLVGVATFAVRLDDTELALRMKDLTGCEVSIFNRNRIRVATTLIEDDGTYSLNPDLMNSIYETVFTGKPYVGRIPFVRGEVYCKYIPIFTEDDPNSDVAGIFFAGYYTATDTNRMYFFIFFGTLITLIIILACFIIGRSISGSVQKRHDAYLFEINKAQESLRFALNATEAANKAKSSFLASMSHEIRTPMNGIVGFSELALDDEIPSKTAGYLHNILTNSKWLMQIINDILDISKIESGKMELENIPFDLHEMFAACRTVIQPIAIEKGLVLHFYAEPSIGKRIYGDPTRLRQVLVNLLSNAVKFTNSGIIKMIATIKCADADSVTMCFEVKDSGIGIHPDQIGKIFEQFVQAESGTTRKFGGTGLGLSITRNLIEIMGGELQVESTPGVGSKFSFELTFETKDIGSDDEPAEETMLGNLKKPTFKGEILLCEDNDMNQQVICDHIERVGLKTVVAENGQIGLDIVKDRMKKGEKQFDLVFMDMHMPVMDGLEAAEEIFKLNLGIPIVALTANVMTEDRNMYLSAGMDSVLGKPFTSQELWYCLMKYFNPVAWRKEDAALRGQADQDNRRKLIDKFVKNNRDIIKEITDAINAADIKLAHRLVHTLKGNAGQLGKTLLQKAAEEVESNLKGGENLVTPQQMKTLEEELNAALKELEPQISTETQAVAETLNGSAVRELLAELESLLEDDDSKALGLTDRLRSIPGSEKLIEHIDNMDFGMALASLAELKKKA